MIDVQPLERLEYLFHPNLSEVEKQERRDKKQALRRKWCRAWIKEHPRATEDDKSFLHLIEDDGLISALSSSKICGWKCSVLMKQAKRVEALYDTGYLP